MHQQTSGLQILALYLLSSVLNLCVWFEGHPLAKILPFSRICQSTPYIFGMLLGSLSTLVDLFCTKPLLLCVLSSDIGKGEFQRITCAEIFYKLPDNPVVSTASTKDFACRELLYTACIYCLHGCDGLSSSLHYSSLNVRWLSKIPHLYSKLPYSTLYSLLWGNQLITAEESFLGWN